jgi:hypothetical protein
MDKIIFVFFTSAKVPFKPAKYLNFFAFTLPSSFKSFVAQASQMQSIEIMS